MLVFFRLVRFVLITGVVTTGLSSLGAAPRASATAPGSVLYSPNLCTNSAKDASYPRVIRLQHQSGSGNGNLLATFSHSGYGGPPSGNVPGGVSLNQWYHLTLTVEGCQLTAAARPVTSWDSDVLTYDDTSCTVTSGAPGARTFNAPASWRFLQVDPG